MINQLKTSWRKNAPELLELIKGNFPKFVTQAKAHVPLSSVPVFVFHSVQPDWFEAQLQHLKNNHYKTVNADELETLSRDGSTAGNEIALTFDDATWSFWTYAYPLLVKYNYQAILFAIPGIVPDSGRPHPNLMDHWEGRCELEELESRAASTPLCTWDELREMHKSGHVDIQSHSLTHSRIPVSDVVIDFLHPAFDTDFYGNVNIPISPLDDKNCPERTLSLGTPVFQNVSRMTCSPMYTSDPELFYSLRRYVLDHGDNRFFKHKAWKKRLYAILKTNRNKYTGTFESQAQAEKEVVRELATSKALLEEKLESKCVQHFCYPWFQGSTRSDELARQSGYRTVHYGFSKPALSDSDAGEHGIARITRISEEFLFRLPGRGRKTLLSVWSHRARLLKTRLEAPDAK